MDGFHASTSVAVHTRRLTPTQKQAAEADEGQSHVPAVERAAQRMTPLALSGAPGRRHSTKPKATPHPQQSSWELQDTGTRLNRRLHREHNSSDWGGSIVDDLHALRNSRHLLLKH